MEVRDEALGVTPGRTTSSADLGGKHCPFQLLDIYTNKHFR